MRKWIYHFTDVHPDNSSIELLGNKGFNLGQLFYQKFPVPNGFVITTQLHQYYATHCALPKEFSQYLASAVNKLENGTGKVFGNCSFPLLVSVRSSGIASMPGMMDTILNVGINDLVVESLAKRQGESFALDIYARFIQMYSEVVLKIPAKIFVDISDSLKSTHLITNAQTVTIPYLKELILKFKEVVKTQSSKDFPQDPHIQLVDAVKAILDSWMNSRAISYRKMNNISDSQGTAVVIQSMVFGNMNKDSGTGVVFTRNPSTGFKELYGEFLLNAQGEDIVSGSKTPDKIFSFEQKTSLNFVMPQLYNELKEICNKLELLYSDMQDIEFTIEQGKLYILQTRPGKRTASAAVKIAVDMVKEGMISKDEAIFRVEPSSLKQLLHANVDYTKPTILLAKGLPASPGAAVGDISISDESTSTKSILIRNETNPEDIQAIHSAAGLMTTKGGMTSHAAVITRGMGKPCISGVNDAIIDYKNLTVKIGNCVLKQGDQITIDGCSGNILLGQSSLINPELKEEFKTFMSWVDNIRNIKVFANAETKQDISVALKFGAEGIGLCRTEHMFFEARRMNLIRQVILTQSQEQRKDSLDLLLQLHRSDLLELFKSLNGLPIIIRLLDPPLHEFLPKKNSSEYRTLLENTNLENKTLKSMEEVNPMLGNRGCRLGITSPEIYSMQVRAIFEAAAEYLSYNSSNSLNSLEIMVPLVSDSAEFLTVKQLIKKTVAKIELETGLNFVYKIGTMIELPRAALQSYKIAAEADFFSFGTNDLTQTTYGISRDDASSFLEKYVADKVFPYDPFIVIDKEGVGELMKIAIDRGKNKNPDLKIGVCGEHAGNPLSIEFFTTLKADYISCSPYNIPVAKLAAAQAEIKKKSKHFKEYRI